MVSHLAQVVPPWVASRSVDARLLLWLHHHAGGHRLDDLARTITRLGTLPYIVAATIALLAVASLFGRSRDIVAVPLAVWSAKSLSPVLKRAFERPRPHLWNTIAHESSYSMPSGHATGAAAVAATAVLVCWHTRARWPVTVGAVAYAGAIGWSRLYLGVHWPSDVLAGWALGTACALVSFALVHGVLPRRSRVDTTDVTDTRGERD